jgi:hypothetical protein
MKKTLITVVLATFLLSMPLASEGRESLPGDELQTNALTVSTISPALLQSIGIGRRRTVRRRRRVRRMAIRHRRMTRRVVRHRRTMRRRAMRRRGRGISLGVGVRRGRRY